MHHTIPLIAYELRDQIVDRHPDPDVRVSVYINFCQIVVITPVSTQIVINLTESSIEITPHRVGSTTIVLDWADPDLFDHIFDAVAKYVKARPGL